MGGVVTLFLMPLVLIVTVTIIQDNTFKKVNNSKIPILLVDYDNGNVSKTVCENLQKSNVFTVITKIESVMGLLSIFVITVNTLLFCKFSQTVLETFPLS